jgi:hypothetical protein
MVLGDNKMSANPPFFKGVQKAVCSKARIIQLYSTIQLCPTARRIGPSS